MSLRQPPNEHTIMSARLVASGNQRTEVIMYYNVHITKKQFIFLSIFFFLAPVFGSFYLSAADQFPSFFLPCGLKTFFHLYCPGCGGTHALEELLRFHLVESFLYNPLVLYMAGCLLYYYVKFAVQLIRQRGNACFSIYLGFLWVFLIIMILFCIVRNILLVRCGTDYLGELAQYW